MAEKFSIMTNIDTEKLKTKIAKYSIQNKINDIYLFASRQTIKQLVRQCPFDISQNANILSNMPFNEVVCKYNGCKVFTDDTLDFGEIELR